MNDIERIEERMDKLEEMFEEIKGQIGSNRARIRNLGEDFNDIRYEMNDLDNKVENLSRRPSGDK